MIQKGLLPIATVLLPVARPLYPSQKAKSIVFDRPVARTTRWELVRCPCP